MFQIESGDRAAAEQLFPLVYDELRKLAAARMSHENPSMTLQATALVHDAYLRLVIFTSDNGGVAKVASNAPLRGFKGSTWEGGQRESLQLGSRHLREDRRGRSIPRW